MAEWLWPDRPANRAQANLRQAVYEERRSGNIFVRASRHELWLDPSVAVDLHDVITLIHQLLDRPAYIAPTCSVSSFVNDLLPGWDEPWLEVERVIFRELRLHALEGLSEVWLQEGRSALAIEAVLAAAAIDPLRETAHALLIGAYLAERSFARAREVLEAYSARLRQELGTVPSPALVRMVTDAMPPGSSTRQVIRLNR